MCLVPLRSSTRGALLVGREQAPDFDETAYRIVQAVARLRAARGEPASELDAEFSLRPAPVGDLGNDGQIVFLGLLIDEAGFGKGADQIVVHAGG